MQDEFRYEKIFGIKTAAIKTNDSGKFHHYQGASYRVLRRLLCQMPAYTRDYEFVDIGCGKGRAVFVAENFGYENLTGIELDKELFLEAGVNLENYALKRSSSVIDFVHADALAYNYKNKPTVYFLFNPFNDEVLREVIKKISVQNKHEAWFIYMNPLYKNVFEEMQISPETLVKTGFYLEAVIYRINQDKSLK